MSPRIGARRLHVVLGLGVLLCGTLGGTFAVFESAAQASVNLPCPQGATEYKVDGNPLNGLSNGESKQFTVNGQTFTFTKVSGSSPFVDDTFDFTSTIAVSVAYVKGGVDTNEYDYAPATTSGSGLHPPLNGGDEAPAISHVLFCVGGSGTTTSTTIPGTSTSTTVPQSSTSTSTTVPQTSTSTSTTVPQTSTSTSTTVPETTTSTTVPETTTSTTVPETTTSTTVPETTTSTTVPETTTSTTVPEETTTSTTVPEETTTSIREQGSTTIVTTTTTEPKSTTTLTHPATTTQPVTVPGTLPRTGSGSAFAAMFGVSCVAAGVLLMARKRRSWSRP